MFEIRRLLWSVPQDRRKTMHSVWKALKKMGCSVENDRRFIIKLFKQHDYANQLQALLKEMMEASIPFDALIFQKMIDQPDSIETITEAIQHFLERGIRFEKEPEFYGAVLVHHRSSFYLAQAITLLYEPHHALPDLLFNGLKRSVFYAQELIFVFRFLDALGFDLINGMSLYLKVIENAADASELLRFYKQLAKLGYVGYEVPAIYELVAENAVCGEELVRVFEILAEANLGHNNISRLCFRMRENIVSIEQFLSFFSEDKRFWI